MILGLRQSSLEYSFREKVIQGITSFSALREKRTKPILTPNPEEEFGLLGKVLSGLFRFSLDIAYPRHAEWFKAQHRKIAAFLSPFISVLVTRARQNNQIEFALTSVCSDICPFQPYFIYFDSSHLMKAEI